jgi:hypothetical protein
MWRARARRAARLLAGALRGPLVLWGTAWAVVTTIEALNEIHDVAEGRCWWHRYLIAAALARSGRRLPGRSRPRRRARSPAARRAARALRLGRWPAAVGLVGFGGRPDRPLRPCGGPEPPWRAPGPPRCRQLARGLPRFSLVGLQLPPSRRQSAAWPSSSSVRVCVHSGGDHHDRRPAGRASAQEDVSWRACVSRTYWSSARARWAGASPR